MDFCPIAKKWCSKLCQVPRLQQKERHIDKACRFGRKTTIALIQSVRHVLRTPSTSNAWSSHLATSNLSQTLCNETYSRQNQSIVEPNVPLPRGNHSDHFQSACLTAFQVPQEDSLRQLQWVTTTLCCTYPKHCRSYRDQAAPGKEKTALFVVLGLGTALSKQLQFHDQELPVCHEFMFMCLTCRGLTHFEAGYSDNLLGSCSLWISNSLKWRCFAAALP